MYANIWCFLGDIRSPVNFPLLSVAVSLPPESKTFLVLDTNSIEP